MAHLRTRIRNAFRTAITGLASTGSHVYLSRARPWALSELPGLSISLMSETSVAYTPPLQVRKMQLSVDAVCRAAPGVDIDALLDQIALEVETAAYMATALRVLILDLYLESVSVDVSGESDQTLAVATMVWAVTYQVETTDFEAVPGS